MHFLARMRFFEQLLWNLSEVIDEADGGVLLQRIINVINVHVSLVEQVVEHVD